MLDTETDKEQKLKELYQRLEQLQAERKELQDEKDQLSESFSLKEEDFIQLQNKVSQSMSELILHARSSTMYTLCEIRKWKMWVE